MPPNPRDNLAPGAAVPLARVAEAVADALKASWVVRGAPGDRMVAAWAVVEVLSYFRLFADDVARKADARDPSQIAHDAGWRNGQPPPVERKLIGPPKAHWDGPCSDRCHEPAGPMPEETGRERYHAMTDRAVQELGQDRAREWLEDLNAAIERTWPGTGYESVAQQRDVARAEAAEARDDAAQLRYERHLLGSARLAMDLIAAGTPDRWDSLRAEAERIAQAIVDEIGHPVTDEPARGPWLRVELARVRAEVERLTASVQAQIAAKESWIAATEQIKDAVTRPLCLLLGVQYNEEIVPAVNHLRELTGRPLTAFRLMANPANPAAPGLAGAGLGPTLWSMVAEGVRNVAVTLDPDAPGRVRVRFSLGHEHVADLGVPSDRVLEFVMDERIQLELQGAPAEPSALPVLWSVVGPLQP